MYNWIGAIALLIGLVLLIVAGWSYYEIEQHKPIPVGIEGLLMKYRLWIGIGGIALVVVGSGLVYKSYTTLE